MTPNALRGEKYGLQGVYSHSHQDLHFEGHPLYVNLKSYLQGSERSESFPASVNEPDPGLRAEKKRPVVLEPILGKLSVLQIPGREHVEAYLCDQHRRQCRPNTVRNSHITIGSFLGFVKGRAKTELQEIVREDVEAWIEHEQDRGLKASTVDMRLRTLKAFLRFLAERDLVRPEVLCRRMSVKVPDALPRAMDPEDVRRLLSVIVHARDRAMVMVLLRTGMRIGELLSTLVGEVNLRERKIEIYEAEKTRIGRVVYVSEDALAVLKAWLKKTDPGKPYLFYAQGKQRMSYTAARAMFCKYLHKAGLSEKSYTLHSLRHTFATDLLNAGMRLECLQHQLGHSSVEMTRRYARLSDKTREQEYFKAMSIIEREESDERHQLDYQLPPASQAPQLLNSYDQQLHEHP